MLATSEFDVDERGLQHLVPAERKQLPGQGGRALRRLDDLPDIPPLVIGTAGVGRETFRVPEDDGQQVVEIVGHAAGELPDGVHLLRLTQFPFERLAFGDIDRDGEQTIPAPVPRPADLMAHVQPMDAPVGPENPELRRTINAGRHRRLARHSERFAVVGVDQLVVRLHRAVKRAVRHAVHGGHRL